MWSIPCTKGIHTSRLKGTMARDFYLGFLNIFHPSVLAFRDPTSPANLYSYLDICEFQETFSCKMQWKVKTLVITLFFTGPSNNANSNISIHLKSKSELFKRRIRGQKRLIWEEEKNRGTTLSATLTSLLELSYRCKNYFAYDSNPTR